MYETDVVDCTQRLTALPTLSGNQNRKGRGIEIVIMEAQSQVPFIESENNICPLSNPINVQRLKETLTNHPDQEFVLKLSNNLRYGADSSKFSTIFHLSFPKSCETSINSNYVR